MNTDDIAFACLTAGAVLGVVASMWGATDLSGDETPAEAGRIARWRTRLRRDLSRGKAVAKQIGENAKK